MPNKILSPLLSLLNTSNKTFLNGPDTNIPLSKLTFLKKLELKKPSTSFSLQSLANLDISICEYNEFSNKYLAPLKYFNLLKINFFLNF